MQAFDAHARARRHHRQRIPPRTQREKRILPGTTLGTGLARTGTNRFAKYVEQERRAEAAGFLPPEAKGELRGAPTSYLLVADEITAAAGGEAKLGDFRAVLALLEPRF
jgi:hypothetical protein